MEQLQQLAREKLIYQERAKGILKGCLQEFMKEHPEIKALGWTQYTPYFNDGEACVFSMHELYFTTKDLSEDQLSSGGWFEEDEEEGWVSAYSKPGSKWIRDNLVKQKISEELYAKVHNFYNILQGLESELQTVLGDHVKVIITERGVETHEFEHD
jgi:hypothetical protein